MRLSVARTVVRCVILAPRSQRCELTEGCDHSTARMCYSPRSSSNFMPCAKECAQDPSQTQMLRKNKQSTTLPRMHCPRPSQWMLGSSSSSRSASRSGWAKACRPIALNRTTARLSHSPRTQRGRGVSSHDSINPDWILDKKEDMGAEAHCIKSDCSTLRAYMGILFVHSGSGEVVHSRSPESTVHVRLGKGHEIGATWAIRSGRIR